MSITHRTAAFEQVLKQEDLAAAIANLWTRWDDARDKDMRLKREIRAYVFATDTSTTTNGKQDWRNKTHIPKLCQIRDNLHANYFNNMFSSQDWLVWEPGEVNAATLNKKRALEAYCRAKLEDSDFRTLASRLIYDWIDYGNAFAGVEWVLETNKEADGSVSTKYIGPRAYRISPEDIVFDPLAATFEQSPVVIRSLKSLGDFEKDLLTNPGLDYDPAKVQEVRDRRKAVKELAGSHKGFARWKGITIDGFGYIAEYFNSGQIEILEFIGDYYDEETGILEENVIITVADRCTVLRRKPNPTWGGRRMIHHAGWRLRPDNLWAMGPLDNLAGIQYRINHLENLKADAGDMTLFPPTLVRGWVEDFEWAPRERIDLGADGEVTFPNTGIPALVSVDTQIAWYISLMEEMAGSPREAAGFRTPGEKTKYEVQRLENAANRVFEAKTSYLEEAFIEKLVQSYAIAARENFRGAESVRTKDNTYGATEFLKVTREDLMSKGTFRAVGARHHAEYAQKIQNITQFANSPLGQDPGIRVHVSSKALAKAIEDWLGLSRYGFVQDYIGLAEAAELQEMQQSLTPKQEPDTISGMIQQGAQ